MDMHDEIKKLGILILATLLITGLLIPTPTYAQAEKPEWEEGYAWAMGTEGDIQEIFSPTLDQLDEMIEQEIEDEEDLHEIDYDIDGEMGFYQIYEVIEADDDGYVMEIEAGGGIQASGSLEMTGELEQEGVYEDDEDPPMETKTISIEGEFYFIVDIEGTIRYDPDLAIEEIDLTYSLEFSAEFSVENFPSHDYDREEETRTIEYEDFSGGISADMSLNLEMEFEPALDFFNFPINVGDSWILESEMTVSGSYEGEIDVDDEEMPEEFQVMIEEMEAEMEQEFPIILEEIDTGEDEVNFGEIEETTVPINIPMVCTGRKDVVLYDGDTTNAYVLEFDIEDEIEPAEIQDPSFQMMYSDEQGFLVSQEMHMPGEMAEMLGMTSMEMRSMEVEDAREGKEEIQDVEDEGWMDILFSPPYLYAVLGLIVVIVLVGVLLGKKGKKQEPRPPRRDKEQENLYGEERSYQQPGEETEEQRYAAEDEGWIEEDELD